MSSMYGQYIKERLGRGILETDKGFVTFEYPTSEIVYIIDIFILPEYRKQHSASVLADQVCLEAKKNGAKQVMGSVDISTKSASDSLKVLLAYGMKPYRTAGNAVYLIKDIEV